MNEPTTAPTFKSFDEFWPYYVGEHLNPVTRWMHFAGTTAAMATLGVAAVTRKPSLALLAAVMGYGPAWASHFFVEHNQPATFKHPLWSLRGDLVMWKKMIDGSMTAEIEKVLAAREAGETRDAEQGVEHDAAPPEPEKRVRVEPTEHANEGNMGLGEPPLNGVAR
jgi:hypothetical protein